MWRPKTMADPKAAEPSLPQLLGHLRALISERHPISAPAALRQAEQYLIEQFRSLGLEVTTHAFRALGGTYRNVIATRSFPGRPRSEPAGLPLIVAAHYDTVPHSPGADDNASGLAVMLEVARCLREVPLAGELRFLAFCLEEEDLLGSLAYCARLRESREQIRGAIVLECVGYTCAKRGSQLAPPGTPITVPSVGDFLGIVGNSASGHLMEALEQATDRHTPDLKTVSLLIQGKGEQLPDSRRSDHAAFWHYGYPAVMLTDTGNFRNPHYHQPSDKLETLDLRFMQQVAQSVAVAALRLCG